MHFPDVVRIAQQAWDKTKPASDPVWNECDGHHRQVFIAIAQAVVDSGHAVNDFEHAVKRLAQEVQQKSEGIAAVAAEQSASHSDEIQLEAARRSGQLDEPKAMAAAASPQSVARAAVIPEAPAKPKRKPKGAGKKSTKKASN